LRNKKESLRYFGLLRLSRQSRGDIGLRQAEKGNEKTLNN